jgi:hypothetical protein
MVGEEQAMTNTLEFVEDLSGQNIGQFQVIRQTAHRRYVVRCDKCGSTAEGMRHDDILSNPRCFNRGCDRPTPTTLASFQEEQEEQDAAERAERERPLREAEREFTQSLTELQKAVRERIVNEKEDEQTWRSIVDTVGTRMTPAQAEAHNVAIVTAYRESHPEWHPTESNIAALTSYWKRNSIGILSAQIIERSVERLREYGLLEERPEPTLEPELLETIPPAPEPEGDGSEEGYSDETGERVRLSRYHIDRMDSATYKRFKRIPFDQLRRPVHTVR